MSEVRRVPLDALTRDRELQPRAAFDRVLLDDYVAAMVEGARFPPVVAFEVEPGKLLLADGWHRWDAFKVFGRTEIAVDVREGSREDAIKFALTANAAHGARRKDEDYAHGFGQAIKLGLLAADEADTAKVIAVLGCSIRRAERLTQENRERVKAYRDAEIAAKAAQGKSLRQIAAETGISHTGVSKVLDRAVNSAAAAESLQQEADDDPEPQRRPRTAEDYKEAAVRDVENPEDHGSYMTHDAIRAMMDRLVEDGLLTKDGKPRPAVRRLLELGCWYLFDPENIQRRP